MPPRRHRVVITHGPLPSNAGAAIRRHPRAPAAPVFVHRNAVDDGPRVLLLHGEPGSALIWARLEPSLRARGLDVQIVDNAGAVTELLEARNRAPMVIVGHGFGAGVAVALAATAPDSTRALILVAPALRSRPRRRRLFGQVRCPTLVIAGLGDQVTPLRDVSAVAARLPGALLAPTDNGHLIPLDDPDLVLTAVLRAREFQPPETTHLTQRRN